MDDYKLEMQFEFNYARFETFLQAYFFNKKADGNQSNGAVT